MLLASLVKWDLRGTEDYCGLSGVVDIINSTLGKVLGGASGGLYHRTQGAA